MSAPHSPRILTSTQRMHLTQIPSDMATREVAYYYTLTPDDRDRIARHRGPHNRLGFAVQLCALRFPGRSLTDLHDIPWHVLQYIARQIDVPESAFAQYGQRAATISEHLREICQAYGYRSYDWRAMRMLTRTLLPLALESDRGLPLAEAALDTLRAQQIIAPGITTLERLLWVVRQQANRLLVQRLTGSLTPTQRDDLDGLLHAVVRHGPDQGKTMLSWLRTAAGKPSARQLKRLLSRVQALLEIPLPPFPDDLHRHRVRQLSRQAQRMSPHALAALSDPRRHALMVAHLHDLRQDQIDGAVDMFDQFMGELMRKGERAQEQHVLQHAKTMNAYLRRFADGLEAFRQALVDDRDPSLALLQELPLSELEPALAAIRALARPADFDYLDLVETRYGPARSALLAFYRTLTFEPMIVRDPALRALDHVMTLYARNQRVTAIEQTVGTTTYIAPLEHLTNRWRPHVVQGATIQSTLYEAAAFDRLKAELRSGDVAVNQSRRYGSFESSLIPRDRWDHLKATGQTRLAITDDAQSYLEQRDQEIQSRFTTLHQQLGTDAGAVTVDQQGNLHLTRPEPSTPPEVKALRRRLGRMLPVVDLPDLLAEVQGWVPFLDRATHARTGAPLESTLHAPVLAALIAQGTNIGWQAMERASPFSYEQLSSATDWYLHEESLKWMLIDLDHFLLHHPLSALWGDGTRSSSDGLRMRVAVQAANADPNTRYCDVTRGLTMYLHIADVGPPFGRQVFGVNEREYLHVLDTIYHHETELDIQEHSTDTAGGTDHLFALSYMFGLRFYPRLADILGRQYFTLRPPGDYGPLNQLIKGRIDPRPVVATWDDMQRVAASIPHGMTSATVLMRQLQNQGPASQIAQGFTQAGRLERTVYQLDYLLDLLVRDRVGRILARGELFNAMARACFFGRRGVLYERTLRAQLHTASCLIVMMAGCQAWTIVYLWAAIQTLRSQGEDLPDELLAHLSPTMWKHINLLGHYHFSPEMPWSLTNLRPLRSDQGRDEEDDEED